MNVTHKHLLFLAPLSSNTGNETTALRIEEHLGVSHRLTLVDADQTSAAELKAIARDKRIDAAIGLHALLSGPLLCTLDLPYALILGGTDIYQPVHELQERAMQKAVRHADALVGFCQDNILAAERKWPGAAKKGFVVPHAVDVRRIDSHFDLRAHLGLPKEAKVVLHPSSIRAIKDPLHIVQSFEARFQGTQTHLVVAGPILEEQYGAAFLDAVSACSRVLYCPALPRTKMLKAMRDADAVLNASQSEGMSQALLEAMAIGTPVLARDNAGNRAVVKHGVDGLIYQDPADAVEQLRWLVGGEGSTALSHTSPQALIARASAKVLREHSLASEFRFYAWELTRYLDRSSAGRPDHRLAELA